MFSNLKISARIGIAITVPLLVLTITAIYILYGKHEEKTAATGLKISVEAVSQVTELIYNLQKERGISAVFISSHGAQGADALPALKQASDGARKATEIAFSALDKTPLAQSLATGEKAAWDGLSQLNAKRQAIADFSITASDSSAYFTQTISRLLDLVVAISNSGNNADVQKKLSTLMAFAQAMERAGQERAVGAGAFSLGRFADDASYKKFASIVTEETTWFHPFESYASPDLLAFYKKTVSGPIVDKVLHMRQIALDAGASGDLSGVNGKDWFEAATARIDLMKEVENRISSDAITTLEGVYSRATGAYWMILTIALIVLFLTAIIGFYSARTIINPVKEITSAIEGLAAGNYSIKISSTESRDEIGIMARASEQLRQSLAKAKELEAQIARQKLEAEAHRKRDMQDI